MAAGKIIRNIRGDDDEFILYNIIYYMISEAMTMNSYSYIIIYIIYYMISEAMTMNLYYIIIYIIYYMISEAMTMNFQAVEY